MATSQAVAQSICNCLKTGVGIAQAISTASSSGNAATAAQAIAEAASGGAFMQYRLQQIKALDLLLQWHCSSTKTTDPVGWPVEPCFAAHVEAICHGWFCRSQLLLAALPSTHAGVAQASAEATAEAVYEALTCNCACEGPTAQALAQAVAKANGGGCGNVATALSGKEAIMVLGPKRVLCCAVLAALDSCV